MDTLFRIHTEGINQQETEAILNEVFPAYTLIYGKGFWRGRAELSLIVEIYAPSSALPLIQQVSEQIRERNKQESVLVASFPVHTHLITGATTNAKELTRA